MGATRCFVMLLLLLLLMVGGGGGVFVVVVIVVVALFVANSLALGHPSNRVVTYNIVDDFSKNAAACGLSAGAYMSAIHAANLR
eukprot:207073-Rhodomonas_salina.2